MAASSPAPLFLRFQRHAASRTALLVAVAWGFAEATLFFVIPDVYLAFLALFRGRRAWSATAVAVLGALAGGALLYVWATRDAATASEWMARVPLISPAMVVRAAAQTQSEGAWAVITATLQGIPYKLYAVQAGQQSMPLVEFLLMTVPARLERFLPVALAGAVMGRLLDGFVRRRTRLVVALYVLLWAGVYAVYAVQVSRGAIPR